MPGDSVDEDRSRPLSSPFVSRTMRWGIVAWSAIGVLILGYILFRYVVYPIRIIFPPLVVAIIAVYLLNPVVTALERRGMRRVWGALLVYLVAGALVGTALYFAVPVVAEQVGEFARAAPDILRETLNSLEDFAGRLGVQLDEGAAPDTQSILGVVGSIFSVTRPLFDVALVMVLGPILAFYLVVDLPKIKRNAQAVVPSRRRREVDSVTKKIGRAIGSYFRGQLLVAGFVAVAASLVLWIVGLPFWALVGLISGLFNLIPLIGPFIGAALAILIAITTEETGGLLGLDPGWPLALGASIALLIVQQIDNHIISPNMIGRTVRLHPVTVVLGLLVGGALMGLWGMLLAIPVIATVKVVILHLWDTRMTWPPPSSGEYPVERERPVEREVVPASPGQPEEQPHEARPPPWWHAIRGWFGGRRPPAPGPEPRERSSTTEETGESTPERVAEAPRARGS
jgi:predicted PurR-regulated permease PerM